MNILEYTAKGTDIQILPFRLLVRKNEHTPRYFVNFINTDLTDWLGAYLGTNVQAVAFGPVETKIGDVDGYTIDFSLHVAREDLELYDKYIREEGWKSAYEWFRENIRAMAERPLGKQFVDVQTLGTEGTKKDTSG